MIYFIQSSSGPIKIGFTNGDAQLRLLDLQTGSAYGLVLLATITGVHGKKSRERSLHARFAEHRMRGEWFANAGPLIDFIIKPRPFNSNFVLHALPVTGQPSLT